MKEVISLLAGFLFALGLGLSGMTQPHIVRGFLDIFGDWDYRLLGVMVGAILFHSVIYHYFSKKSSPLLDSKFHLPKNKTIDQKLILGSALFGLGWGWSGICPGPSIVFVSSGKSEVYFFIISMLIAMKLTNLFNKSKEA